MKDSEKKEFAQILTTTLVEIYGQKPPSQGLMRIWWASFARHPIQQFQQAMNRHIQSPDTGKWPPKPADLIAMISGTTGDRALAAWSKVDRAVRDLGPWCDVAFDDPVIHTVIVDMGGWEKICDSRDETEQSIRSHEFRKRYEGASRGEKRPHLPVLPGAGKSFNPPMMIGNPDRCQRVIESGSAAAKAITYTSAAETALTLLNSPELENQTALYAEKAE